MTKLFLSTIVVLLCLASCASHQLPHFSRQKWHIDEYSGNAVSTSGIELAFGSEWMITDTTLIQSANQIANYPKLSQHLAIAIDQFPEIKVDSILFYNPNRGLLFALYHQVKPLKPSSEIFLCNDTSGVYSPEFARTFGTQYTIIDDSGWEKGPKESVFTNVKYSPRNKRIVLLQRIPYNGQDIAILQILVTKPHKGKWWEEYPPGTFWNVDLGNTDNLESISNSLLSSRNLAVENLKLSISKRK